MIQIQLINKQIAQECKNDIILYLEQVLNINYITHKPNDLERIYENMINYIEDGSAIIIGAFENDKLIGFIWTYKIIQNDEQRLHINYFIVNENKRRCGIGEKLLNEIYKIAKKNNINKLELMVTAKNSTALKFYEKQNFKTERIKLCKEI